MSGSNTNIRVMQKDDLDAVMVVEQAAYPIPWSRGVFDDCLAGRNLCYVFECDNQVIGHAVTSIIVDETHLLNLCISPLASGQGFGRQLLRYLIDDALVRRSAMFYLEVRPSNHAAIQLYFSEGFNEVGTRPNYYPALNGREDALLMTLELSIDQYV